MRILQVVGGLNRGGTETWLVQLLQHIDRQEFQMDFLVHTEEPGAYDDEVRACGARILPCLSPSHPLQYARNFRRIVHENGPYDCVHGHVHRFTGSVLLLSAMLRIPIRIAHAHSDTRSADRQASIFARLSIAFLKALVAHFAQLGVAVSANAAEALFPRGWKADARWRILPLGIDMRPFAQICDRVAVRTELGIPPDARVVGHVGRFCAVKNHRFIVEIAQQLCAMAPQTVFLLIGDGPLREETEQLIRSRGLEGNFVFAGVRKDVPRLLMGAMDCFLLPSLYEGLPMALLEAQAAGLPCLVADTVSSEGDLGKSAVQRLPLSATARVWAGELQAAAAKPKRFPAAETWSRERSVAASAEAIAHLYRSAIHSPEAREGGASTSKKRR